MTARIHGLLHGGVGFVAKDPWAPAIRREHHVARHLAERGVPVAFMEASADLRLVRSEPTRWLRHLIKPEVAADEPQDLARARVA